MKQTLTKKAVNAVRKNPGKSVAIGAGAVALGAAAYYFLGPKGKQHRAKAKEWTADAQKAVVRRMSKARELTEASYRNLVDEIISPYVNKGAAGAAEARAFAQAMKRDWKKFTVAAGAAGKTTATTSTKRAPRTKKPMTKAKSPARKTASARKK